MLVEVFDKDTGDKVIVRDAALAHPVYGRQFSKVKHHIKPDAVPSADKEKK